MAMDEDQQSATTRGDTIRVLLWSRGGSGLHYGGPGSSAFRLYTKWQRSAEKEVQVDLAHASANQADLPLFDRQVQLAASGSALDQWRLVRRGRSFLRENASRYDIFHGVDGFTSTITPAFEATRLGVPACIKLAAHRTDLADKPVLRHKLLRLAASRRRKAKTLAAMICISRSIMEECLEYGFNEDRLALIPDGADTDHFYPLEDVAQKRQLREQLNLKDWPTVTLCGGMVRRKRPDLLIEAAGRLKAQGKDLQVLLVGPEHEADYVADMRKRAKELGVADRVVWAGFHLDVADHLRCSDLFCLPSSQEGLPNAMLEALASGLPTIATQISGAIDLIRPGELGLFVTQTPESVAEAFGQYLDDPDRRHREAVAARELVLENYSTLAAIRRHRTLFRNVISGRPAADAGMEH
jgi:glycosyltransferase involved in cell wall biosynthesis